MKKSLALVAVGSVLASGVALAAPAQAYDKDAYSYAASHMIERSDIPAVLGDFKPTLSFGAGPGSFPSYLCYVASTTPNTEGTEQRFPSGRYQYSASYNGKGKEPRPSIGVTVNQYASAEKAIKAFNVAKKVAKNCTGTTSDSWTDPDTGTVSQYSTLLTNGVVPEVTTTGVESIFISSNNLSESFPGGTPQINDNYTVVSLLDDVVLVTQYYMNSTTNITTKQRRAVDQVAFNAETAWLN